MSSARQDDLRSAFREAVDWFELQFETTGGYWSFDSARAAEAADSYATTIIDRVGEVGALRAACEDAASVLGPQDYDEAWWAVHAVARQWEHVADALDVWDEDAIRVRLVVEQLTTEIGRAESNFEFIADLLAVVAAEDRFLNLALMWKETVEEGREEAFWEDHEEEAIHVSGVKTILAADMRVRGELTVDGRVVLPDEEAEV